MEDINYRHQQARNDAIKYFELPLSLITRQNIDLYLTALTDSKCEIYCRLEKSWKRYHGTKTPCEEILQALSAAPVKLWKSCALQSCMPTSQYHTSRCYDYTDHYDLALVARAVWDYQRLFPVASQYAHIWFCEWMSLHEYKTDCDDITLAAEYRRAESDLRNFAMRRAREMLSLGDVLQTVQFTMELTKPDMERYFGITEKHQKLLVLL